MTRALTYNLAKKIILFLTAGFFLSFGQAAFAQDPASSPQAATGSAESLKKYKITFPIAQLGNCADLAACKAYCDDEANKEACLTFAENKGIGKNRKKLNSITRSTLLRAREELGCSTDQECKTFCKLEENREKCSEFAKTYNLKGGHKLRIGTDSGKLKGPRDATGSGEKFTPNSLRAFERANANARFCRENPGKCTREGSASAELEKKKLEIKLEIEKKKFELKREGKKKEDEIKKLEQELEDGNDDEHEFEDDSNDDDDSGEDSENEPKAGPSVNGVSHAPSFFEQIVRFFFK